MTLGIAILMNVSLWPGSMLIEHAMYHPHPSTWQYVIGIVVFFFGAAATSTLAYFWHKSFSRAVSNDLQLCHACLYDLAATSPEQDGCRVCPECGGAWRLPTDLSSNTTT